VSPADDCRRPNSGGHQDRPYTDRQPIPAQPGAYFVTACTWERASLFGHVVNGKIHLNGAGDIAERCWGDIPSHFPHAALDAFVIMPNHIHGVIVITESRRGEASAVQIRALNMPSKSDASPLQQRPHGTQPRSLPAIVQNFRSVSARKINAACGMRGVTHQGVMNHAPTGFGWQRGYYEHIVRNEQELITTREYVVANPARWDDDKNNPLLLPADR
jgi:putative transposase